MDDDLGSEIEQLTYEKYNALKCGGKPQSHEWTVLAGIVEERGNTKKVIVLTTGTKCVGEHALSSDGLIVNDCHAEILCRRCFIRYLLDHWNDDSLMEYDTMSRRYRVRPEVKYHLYISQSPCGLASEYQQENGKRLAAEIANAKVRASKRRCLDHSVEEYDDAMHRTGAKYVEADTLQLSTKPGRGDRSRSYSCSDKLCMYNHLGYQGGLLSTVMEPVFMRSITISGHWDDPIMRRALFARVDSDASSPLFFHRDAASPLSESEVMKQLDGRKLSASGSSLLWIAPNVSETLIASKGVRLGTNVKKGITEKNRSLVSPSALFAAFKEKCGEKCGEKTGETYWSTKQRANGYQKKKSSLFPSWNRKDRALLSFQ